MIALDKITVAGRQLSVCLPVSYYAQPERSYPVAYVQDGGEMVKHTYNELQHLVASGKLEESIYVGVPPHNRNNEYTPWPAAALLEGNPPFGGAARAYVDELADVYKANIDARYRTKPGPEHTAVIGGSFGGMVSMFAGLWRPDVFGRLGLLSASLWYEGVLGYLERHGPPDAGQRIYMSVGDCEGIYKRNRQRDMVEATFAAHRLWRERGVPEERLRFALDPGGTHDAHYMARNFPKAMQWLFPAGNDTGAGAWAHEAGDAGCGGIQRRSADDSADAGGHGFADGGGADGRHAPAAARVRASVKCVSGAGQEPAPVGRGSGAGQGSSAVERGFGAGQEPSAVERGFGAGQEPASVGRGFGAGQESASVGRDLVTKLPIFGRWTAGYEVPRTQHRILRSERNGREYRIFVSMPPEPPPKEGYPVLYTLDANATFGSIAEAMRLQGRKPHGVEPQVVVGIGYDSEGPMVTKERFIDYTDEARPDELPPRPDDSEWPETGGAEAFASFIEDELKPCIEELLPINRSRQSLFGHSLGGYFAIRMLLLRPDAFRNFIAGSPSIWWKNRILYEWLPTFAGRLERGEAQASLLVGVEMDRGKMLADAEELCRRLEPCAGERFRLGLRKYEGEGHVTMIYPFISEMLRFINTRDASE